MCAIERAGSFSGETVAETLRIGIIGLDTSHVTAFTALLNDPANPNHVPGGKVVVAFGGGSKDFGLSINRVEGFTKELKEKWAVEMVDSPEACAEVCCPPKMSHV